MMIILFEIREPPTDFRAAYAALERSSVKLTFVGPEKLCLLQLSITPIGINDSPHSAKDFLRNSFLSIINVFLALKVNNVYVHTFSIQRFKIFTNCFWSYDSHYLEKRAIVREKAKLYGAKISGGAQFLVLINCATIIIL